MCSFLEKVLVIVMDTIVSEYSYRLSLTTIATLLQSCMAPKIFVAKSSTCKITASSPVQAMSYEGLYSLLC